jgi:osmotically-inducible protein OsmY
MKTDDELEQAVQSELRWTPELDTTDIALKVRAGVVTLTGFARAYRDRLGAENAAKRVFGVRGVANEIQVRDSLESPPTDPEIAREAVATLSRILPGLRESLKVIVHQGHLTLEGSTPLYFQREQAESILVNLAGVKSITNAITVVPHAHASEIKEKIDSAFRRNAQLECDSVTVTTTGGRVTLSGRVRSWSEREEALRTAWAAPGVTEVNNDIVVSP